MAQELKDASVVWGGGIVKCNGSNAAVYTTEQERKSLLEDLLLTGSNPKRANVTAKNPTDADAFVFDNGVIHVYKTCCTTKMKCKYNLTAAKLYNDNTNIWYASFENGKFVVSSDYNEHHDNQQVRMPLNDGVTADYFSFQDAGDAEYGFTHAGIENHRTNVSMFEDCPDLVSCEVPCEMRTISTSTFKNCTSLTSYTVSPQFIMSIENNAFENCSSMPKILIPRYASIGNSAFTKCDSATVLEWDGVTGGTSTPTGTYRKCNMTTIPDSAFQDCSVLTSTKFSGSSSNINGIVIPYGITGVSQNAFYNCSSIPKLYFNGVTTIDTNAFRNNTSLTNVYGFGYVTTVGDSAFTNDYSLYSIDDTSKVSSIGEHAFDGCSSLNSFNFDSCTSIPEYAFNGCSNLSSVYNTSDIVYIDKYAFYGCSNLSSFDFDSCTGMGQYAFAQCTSLTSVSLPQMSNIPQDAFTGCSSITSVTIDNVTGVIGYEAFDSCDIREINIYADTIEQYAFYSNRNLRDATFNQVFTANSNTFTGCVLLSGVTLGTNVTTTANANNCFHPCSSITKVYIHKYDSVVTDLDSAFKSSASIEFVLVNPNAGLIDQYRSTYSSTSWTFSVS